MDSELPRVSIPVRDRLLLHLHDHRSSRDRYIVPEQLTRDGIASACGLLPPNVSRAMRSLVRDGLIVERTATIEGGSRRRKTWHLTETGSEVAQERRKACASLPVILRTEHGELEEVEASQAPNRLSTRLSLLQVLMHAMHEGVLTYGDIRFGPIVQRGGLERPEPGRLTVLAGVHATYDTAPPEVRRVHGRVEEMAAMDAWADSRALCLSIHGLAGMGKSTLAASWIRSLTQREPGLSVCWYPCQPWDTALGLATSLLHRFGIDEHHDPYELMETLPLRPGDRLDVDAWRRRLLAYLTDASAIRERFRHRSGGPPPYWLVVLDDVHLLEEAPTSLVTSLLDVARSTPLRLLILSRSRPSLYDRRDVHTRRTVQEIELGGLGLEAIEAWLADLPWEDLPEPEIIHERTGGHPLAIEFLELYGEATHGDWLRFLDQEIIDRLPEPERRLLMILAKATRPLPWSTVAEASAWEGRPPEDLLSHGLIQETDEGMWLHEALRERLKRDIGE